jgi:ferredoxin
VVEKFSRVDILVNGAGGNQSQANTGPDHSPTPPGTETQTVHRAGLHQPGPLHLLVRSHPYLVCEEVCPVSKKAIQLETATLRGPDGAQVIVQLPHVVQDLCIGCGICEYKYPVSGETPIRVYIPKLEVSF